MTPQDYDIFEAAVRKARAGGFTFWSEKYEFLSVEELKLIVRNTSPEGVTAFLFSPSFAKAFWGEQDAWASTPCTCGGVDFHISGPDAHKETCAKVSSSRGYFFHLKELAITPPDERLKYIEQFL